MLNSFLSFIEKHGLFTSADRLLVAVSGGKDSMVLLDLLQKGGFTSSVAHVNFQLRGDASDGDEAFVKAHCEARNLPFYSVRFATKTYARNRGISTQMAARALRYEWFENLRKEHHFAYIVTAHHHSDNVETALLNFTRGTGVAGLTGMSPKKGFIVRPLLGVSREEINEYAKNQGITWREDASNATSDYARNRIRHDVIPSLKAINPNLEQTFERNRRRWQMAETAVDFHVKRMREIFVQENENVRYLSTTFFNETADAVPVLETLFSDANLRWEQWEAALTANVGATFSSETHTLFIDRTEWIIAPNDSLQPVAITLPEMPEKVTIGNREFRFERLTTLPAGVDFKNPSVAYLNAEKLQFPLTFRTWQNGDRFRPFGMKGSKLLSDYFIDRKYSAFEKQTQLLLTDSQQIMWIIGRQIAQPFAVNNQTESIVKISF